MVLYGGIEYGNTPGGGTPSGGTPGGGVPSGGSGPVGPLVGGLGNLGNLLLGYLGGGGLGPGSQAGQTPTGGQPGTPPPTQHPNPTPGGVPVVVVGDPGSGGGNGSGNNSGNSYQSNEVNIPGFGNVSFSAPSLPPITPAQFGNSPPLSLIAQLTNPNFQAGGGGAPTYDTNVGNSGSVQGAPGQMMEQRRDSPSGPAAQQMPGPAGSNITPWGEAFLGGRRLPQDQPPPQAPPQRQLVQGGPPPQGGMPPMVGGMPPAAPMPPGGAGATESQAQVFKRLKDKLKGMYQQGAITPEEMSALAGLAEGGSAPPPPKQGYGDAFTTAGTSAEVADAAPPIAPKIGATTGGINPMTASAEEIMADRNAKIKAALRNGGDEATKADQGQKRAAAAAAMSEPGSVDDNRPQESIQEQFPQSEPPVHQPASEATAERPYHAPYQAGATRRDRDEEIQDLSKSLPELNAQLNPQKVIEAYQQSYANRANHPTGSNSPLINGVVSRWNRWKYGAQADPKYAPYQAQAAADKYLNSPGYHAQREEYGRQYTRLHQLLKERDDESQAAEKQAHTEQLAAQKSAADLREKQLSDQRRDLEKHLSLMPPSPLTKGMIDRAAKAGLIPDDEGVKERLYADSYDVDAAQKDALERQKAQLAVQKEKADLQYAKEVQHPTGKLKMDIIAENRVSKKDRADAMAEGARLDNAKKRFDNGQMNDREKRKFLADADRHNTSVQNIRYKDAQMAHQAWSEQYAEDLYPIRSTGGGMFNQAQFENKGIKDPVEKEAAVAASNKAIAGRTAKRGELLQQASAARDRAMSANVAQAVSAGDPNRAYYEQVKTSMADGSHTRAELEAGLSKRGLSIKALEAKYGPIGKPGAK